MKNSIFILLICTHTHTATAAITCPPTEQVKNVKLVQAIQNPYDETCWDFNSETFSFDGRQWNVEFGTFLPEAKTVDEALKQGQIYFDKSPLVIKHPTSDKLPNHIVLCDYMPTGRLYWVSALTPPQYGVTKSFKK